ncbi:hypothetical protein GUJ93_ZPchr0001g33106 [Zizania palustris]|uniref:non-specific serine/threonine protein kinase n=1 Tax=Zizania palustris TaxID=103762 RepID=A0A8J5VPS0_ZIZPA|nr:hypothetical protein GUJ93_ZPchr0001g33106 [Zizania palustris]
MPRSPARSHSNSTRARGPSDAGKNIEISREAATTIVALAGLAMLSFVGATIWLVKKKRRRIERPAALPTQQSAPPNYIPSSTGSSLTSDAFYLRSPGYPFMRFSAGSHGFPYSPADSAIGYSRTLFTPENLAAITDDFAEENLLGEGGFGCVFKGILPDGRPVAVKKLKIGNGQGEREFRAEVDTISRVHHRHLVSLVGYCISDGQRMLVYDFVPNNTLYYHLHVNEAAVLDWPTRVKIAAGAARGIAYLHEDCHPWIIHRDIKSSNILLDNNFEAQVSDFGLARLAADSNTHVTTRVMGTFGYLAPEYALSGKLTAKSDVYSFGVVLLELITGRKPVDSSQPLGDESLVEWARPLLIKAIEHREFGDLPDPSLENRFDENEMYHMVGAAAACIRHSAVMRPRMGQVVRALDSLADSNLNNGLQPGRGEVFLEPQSEEIRLFQLREFGNRDCSQIAVFALQDSSYQWLLTVLQDLVLSTVYFFGVVDGKDGGARDLHVVAERPKPSRAREGEPALAHGFEEDDGFDKSKAWRGRLGRESYPADTWRPVRVLVVIPRRHLPLPESPRLPAVASSTEPWESERKERGYGKQFEQWSRP